MCMYVSEICAEGIFVTFPWWLKNVKSRSTLAPFSNERHFEIWFPKKKTIAFFWSKLSKLHKKDPILHVTTTFSLKQGETRTSHGPIPHPLMYMNLPWLAISTDNISETRPEYSNVVPTNYLSPSVWKEKKGRGKVFSTPPSTYYYVL